MPFSTPRKTRRNLRAFSLSVPEAFATQCWTRLRPGANNRYSVASLLTNPRQVRECEQCRSLRQEKPAETCGLFLCPCRRHSQPNAGRDCARGRTIAIPSLRSLRIPVRCGNVSNAVPLRQEKPAETCGLFLCPCCENRSHNAKPRLTAGFCGLMMARSITISPSTYSPSILLS